MARRPKYFTRQRLTEEIAAVLELPLTRHYEKSKAYKIVNAVIQVMTDALLRGEEVSLIGFGTFQIRTRKERKQRQVYFYNRAGKHVEMVNLPAKKYVHFNPSKNLKQFVHEGYHE